MMELLIIVKDTNLTNKIMRKIDRTGEISTNKNGLEMKIIEYKNNKEVRVLFTASGETRVTTYLKFKQGKVYPTWRNRKYNGVDVNQDVRDTSTIALVEEDGSNIAVAIAMALGIIAIVCGAFALLNWI